jgi:hypothetical protein
MVMGKGPEFRLLASTVHHKIPVKITQVDGNHLLCLNQSEALMMASIFQASLLHEPTQRALFSRSEFAAFHRQVMSGLASPVQPAQRLSDGLA